MASLAGRRALVTGASSGLGVCFAEQLAARGADLVITARRADRLEELAARLRSQHGVEVRVVPLDLGVAGASEVLFASTEADGCAIDILINNAGFGAHGRFVDIERGRHVQQLQLNAVALTELTHLFVGRMLDRGYGYILNVASTASFQPIGGYASYAAGKSYVRQMSVAVAEELSGTPVRVCCLCPGPTHTEFTEVAGHEVGWLQRQAFMSADRCVAIGLRGLFAGRRVVVSGWLNLFGTWIVRLTPTRIVVWAATRMMGS